MSRGFTGAVLKALGAGEHRLTVVGVTDLTAHCRRIDFVSPTLFTGPPFEPAGWIRLWVPDLTKPDRFHQRGYTLVAADPESGRFSIDFALHEPDGPATRWARNAIPGDELAATRYGGSKVAIGDPVPDGFLLIGDPASLPAIHSIIEALPTDRPVRVLLEQSHEDDVDLPIAEHPDLTVTWVRATGSPTTLADAIDDRDWSNWWAWVATEMAATRKVRERLKGLGFPRSEVLAQAYWVRGRAMGKSDDRKPSSKDRPGGANAPTPSAPYGAGHRDIAPVPALSTAAETATIDVSASFNGSAEVRASTSDDIASDVIGTTVDDRPASVTTPSGSSSVGAEPHSATGVSGSPGAHQSATSESPVAGSSADTPVRGRWRVSAGSELLAPLRAKLVAAGAVQAVVSLLQLAPFLVVAELCRRALTGADGAALVDLAVTAAVLFGAGTTLAVGLVLATHVMDARFGHEVRRSVVAKLARLPLGWFTDRTSGRVKAAVHDDATSLHYLVTHAVLDVVAVVVTPLAVLAYLFTVDGLLAAVLLVPVITFAILMGRMMRASGDMITRAAEWTARTEAEAISYLDGLPVVRVYDGDDGGAFRRTLDEHARFLRDWQMPFTGQKAVIDMVTRPATSLLLIVAVGTALIAAGSLDLIPFLLLGVTFGAQLMAIAYGFAGLREATAAARRIGLLLTEHELPAITNPTPLPALGDAARPSPDDPASTSVDSAGSSLDPAGSVPRDGAPSSSVVEGMVSSDAPVSALSTGSVFATAEYPHGRTVRFNGVSFAYRPPRRVVADIDLELAPGTVTALVGPSGAGKSTLAALLARFHDVTDGAITVDGVDLRRLSTEELYRTVGFVFQDVSIVHGTVRDNIALTRPDADDTTVEAAARAASIHDRILRLPQRYETVLDGRSRLSGGEAQRIQIARAILADPPVLVLDEATAFADPESEYDVQRALSRLVAGRTVLVIAHRLHTIVDADTIVVIDGGRIVQQGRHADLLAVDGRYRDLWNAARSPHEKAAT